MGRFVPDEKTECNEPHKPITCVRRYISAVIVTPIYSRYPQHRALMQYCGVGLSSLGILLSAFATRPAHLVGTIGVLYPLGGAAVYIPTSVLVFEWFQSQLGLANGLIYR